MAASHRVILTTRALTDLEVIAAYIRQESPANAARVAERLLKGIDSLAFMPQRFRRVGVSRQRRHPIHAMTVRPFIVYYRCEEKYAIVHVLHVRHGRQRPLQERDLR